MEPLIHLHILASGSKGNALLVEGPAGLVMVDCGISRKQVLVRAAALGVDPARTVAALFTHEHSDHVSGAPVFCKRFGGQLLATRGTIGACGRLAELPFSPVAARDTLALAGMRVDTFPTSHDVADPFGLRFQVLDDGGQVLDQVGWCTDTGVLTPQALELLHGCRVLGIEANHDVRMLATGPYPPFLQARVGGAHGHLSNDQCAEALPRLVTDETTTVVGLHLSEKNNLPGLALRTLQAAVPARVDVRVASQHEPMTVW